MVEERFFGGNAACVNKGRKHEVMKRVHSKYRLYRLFVDFHNYSATQSASLKTIMSSTMNGAHYMTK